MRRGARLQHSLASACNWILPPATVPGLGRRFGESHSTEPEALNSRMSPVSWLAAQRVKGGGGELSPAGRWRVRTPWVCVANLCILPSAWISKRLKSLWHGRQEPWTLSRQLSRWSCRRLSGVCPASATFAERLPCEIQDSRQASWWESKRRFMVGKLQPLPTEATPFISVKA